MNHPFSDTFISMAIKSDEIQAQAQEHLGAGNWRNCSLHGPFVIPDWPDDDADRHDSDAWLPLLHQLLGMLGAGTYRDSLSMIRSLDRPRFVDAYDGRAIQNWQSYYWGFQD